MHLLDNHSGITYYHTHLEDPGSHAPASPVSITTMDKKASRRIVSIEDETSKKSSVIKIGVITSLYMV